MPVPVVKTYYRPPQVVQEALSDNGKILTDEQIQTAKRLLDDAESDHPRKIDKIAEQLSKQVSSKESVLPYSVKKINGRYYAVYRLRASAEDALDLRLKKSGVAAGGEGTFKLMQDLDSGEWVGLKVSRASEDERMQEAKTERQNLKAFGMSLGHTKRNKQRDNSPSVFQYYYSVMTLAKGIPLSTFLEKDPTLTHQQWLLIAYRILATYKQNFADRGWAHLDIKPHNIMIDPVTLEITFVDLGFAKKINEELDGALGTPGYIAPEILNLRNQPQPILVNTACDVCSLGQTLRVLFGSKKPEIAARGQDFLPDNKAANWRSRTIKNQRKEIKQCLESMVEGFPEERKSLGSAMKFFESKLIESLTAEFLEKTIKRISYPTTETTLRDVYLKVQSDKIKNFANTISAWLKKQSNPIVIHDFLLNLDQVLAEVIDINFIIFQGEQTILQNLETYKINIIKIDQLDSTCKNYQNHLEKSEVTDDKIKAKKSTVTELRTSLKFDSNSPKTTSERIKAFSTKFEEPETRTTLEQVRDPETNFFFSKVHNILYHTLGFFFKPKGAQLARKVESQLKDFSPRGLTR